MTALEELTQNTQRLLDEYRQLKSQYVELQKQKVLLDEKVYEQRKKLEEQSIRLRRLEVARSLSETDENRQHAREIVNSMIDRVDRAISLINQA